MSSMFYFNRGRIKQAQEKPGETGNMKNTGMVFVLSMMLLAAVDAFAVDTVTLDKVSVLMPKGQVLAILGAPDEMMTLASGLKAEVYHVKSSYPLLHAGCIYNSEGILTGLSFVFSGHTAADIIDRLKHHGFTPIPGQANAPRFAGLDDDTGRPLISIVTEQDNLTTVTTLEKAFYEAQVK